MSRNFSSFAALCLFLLLFSATASARMPSSRLLEASKSEGPRSTHFSFRLSEVPSYSVNVSGQRVDLLLRDTLIEEGLPSLPEDGNFIRMFQVKQGADSLITLLLRRPPSHVDARASEKPERILLDLFWADESSRPSLAPVLSGRSRPTPASVIALQALSSPFSGDWLRFFSDFEQPRAVPLKPSAAVFPELPELELSGPLAAAVDYPGRGDWDSVVEYLLKVDPARLDRHLQATRTLVLGEAFLRLGRFSEAKQVLGDSLLPQQGPQTASRLYYLRGYAKIGLGDPYGALYDLDLMDGVLTGAARLRRHYRLLRAEALLQTGQAQKALKALGPAGRNDAPEVFLEAEAHCASGDCLKALEIFRRFPKEQILQLRPEALRAYAESLYASGEFGPAALVFEALCARLSGTDSEGYARLRVGQSYFRSGEKKLGLLIFRQIRDRWGQTEPGWWASMRINDYEAAGSAEDARPAVALEYGRIAAAASGREIREEAAFKKALTLYLLHDKERSVDALMRFVRDYAGGPLRREADFLLTELVPQVVRQSLETGNVFDALTLVEKNRALLLSGVLDYGFMLELAEAFHRLGLLERSYRVYLYLKDATRERPEGQNVYLPMIQVLLEDEETELVIRYAREYLGIYPDGEDSAEIFSLLLQALYGAERIEEARAELGRPHPQSDDVSLWGGRILLASGELSGAAAMLAAKGLDERQLQALFLRAEALFDSGRKKESLSLYQVLASEPPHAEQARYRLGQIFAETDRGQALKYFADLAEEAESPLWKRLAAESAAELSWQQ